MRSESMFPTNTPRGVQEFIPPHMRKAWEEARKILDRDSINMDDFQDLYGLENVERDKKTVARIEAGFDHYANDAYAETLEAILYEQIELSDWLGPNAMTMKTSRFDDVVHGTDLVVEFEDTLQSVRHLALAVDVTFGTTAMEKKFQKIQAEIDRGTLGTIKYFQSDAQHMRGELKQIPRVVIGIEKKQVIELSRLWVGDHAKDLENHPVQNLILREILDQLAALKRYAERVNQPMISAIYARELEVLKTIAGDKTKRALNDLEDDKVYQSICAELAKIMQVSNA